ncbi:hypothetical protein SAMN04488500_106131 [Sporomusa malonica]|uniref:Uncharacterized protein n=1 Tax=Sporomusa malonica TaxID=112901 RepID=A0A1W2AUY8_9FIRM|nr:hypothetical protein SAMN04488500_106131 [Sporomusa malonica]
MKPTPRKHTRTSHGTNTPRPRRLGVLVKNDEFYSNEDIAAINKGTEQIKNGECVSHAELKRLFGI